MNITIVMYHYIRDYSNTKYPKIKGLDVNEFIEQIQYFKKYYNFISGYDLIDFIKHNKDLPNNSLLLSFDDGYKDHFDYVFPILKKESISGCFFPIGQCIEKHTVLDVNKLHFILASSFDKQEIIKKIMNSVCEYKSIHNLLDFDDYYKEWAKPNRFDTADIIFIKRMLQRVLPQFIRSEIINYFFRKYITTDEISFSNYLYMSKEDIKLLYNEGMFFGSHTYDHLWLDSLSYKEQEIQIKYSLSFLKSISISTNDWIMCYPYGGYNNLTIDILKKYNCIAGFTVNPDIADLGNNNFFTLPRLNTNDFPKIRDSLPNIWTNKILDKVNK